MIEENANKSSTTDIPEQQNSNHGSGLRRKSPVINSPAFNDEVDVVEQNANGSSATQLPRRQSSIQDSSITKKSSCSVSFAVGGEVIAHRQDVSEPSATIKPKRQSSFQNSRNSRQSSTKRSTTRFPSITSRRLQDESVLRRASSAVDVDFSRLTAASRLLAKSQLKAFRKAFDFFDHLKNGKISSNEFLDTLRMVGLQVDEKTVSELVGQSHNEEGMEFEEYLNFMTSNKIFSSIMNGYGAVDKRSIRDKNLLMFQVMTKFIRRSVLDEKQRKDIQGYYSRKLGSVAKKHILTHADHVVHHYSDGARSLGLTEREIYNQIEQIKQLALKERDEKKKNSPYAHPDNLKLTQSAVKKRMAVVSSRQKQPGWRPSHQARSYDVGLPRVKLDPAKKTFANVVKIRDKIGEVKDNYYNNLSEKQRRNSDALWKQLHVGEISTEHLRKVMKDVFDAYTSRSGSRTRLSRKYAEATEKLRESVKSPFTNIPFLFARM